MTRPDVIPIPLRADVTAHIHIPLDLTVAEARKVCAVVMAYACDSDGTATAAANGDLPVPQDCQARPEGRRPKGAAMTGSIHAERVG